MDDSDPRARPLPGRAAATALALLPLLLAACGTPVPEEAPLPPPLAELTLLEGHPTITPVRFSHARHADGRAMGREVGCADCHHPLRDDPRRLPAACTACHLPLHLQPEVDESGPHDHAGPPDL